jgi:hypothetical protein
MLPFRSSEHARDRPRLTRHEWDCPGHNDADDRPAMTLTYPDPDLTDAVVRLPLWRETDVDCIS